MIVPLRAPPRFGATTYPADPLPELLAPDVTVIQLALLEAVHAQPLAVDTLTLPESPTAGEETLVGLIE